MTAPRINFSCAHRPASRRPRTVASSRMAAQRDRVAQLDTLRIQRPLNAAEQAEADNLGHRLYMREYRAQQAERWGGPKA